MSGVRKAFIPLLFEEMGKNEDIVVVTGDLGYKQFDQFRIVYQDRFINVGAAEQLLVGAGIGLALEGKIPILYSMTPFLLYRPFEFIRNYVDHEKIPVKLCGAGRGKDYDWLGWSHWATDDKEHMSGFKNIKKYWPEGAESMKDQFQEFIYNGKPCYVSLSR
jgi:transketolase